MGRATANPLWNTLDDFVEAFEDAQARGGPVELADFLPPADHPLYLGVLRELVRVDLEYGWQRGRPFPLDGYRARFPALFAHRPSLHEITFEEFRLRQQAGEAVTPGEYQSRFGVCPREWPVAPAEAKPVAAGAREVAAAAECYQQLRRREEQGDGAPLSDWFEALTGRDTSAQIFREAHKSDPREADRLAVAVTSFPEPGNDFLGFRLLEELGRGAFGRVYLARQGDLAGRLVALKVSAKRFEEAQTLARLQHTNIVPVYSVHDAGPLQAVCMPFLGAATLADVVRQLRQQPGLPQTGRELVSTLSMRRPSTLRTDEPSDANVVRRSAAGTRRGAADHVEQLPAPGENGEPGRPAGAGAALLRQLEEMSYVKAVLGLGAQLADGLAHAHERGVLHRDLKPANVLLTADGRPMLLDFNLAEDARRGASAALVGGTVPYMAPEHLEVFERGRGSVDARADIYSLGVILYELLAGRPPFETTGGTISEVLAKARAERGQPPPLRARNRDVTPAAAAVVRRCLDPDPARRYPSARALEEDLKRHLADLPLKHTREPSPAERARKWLRRHPRLAVAAAAAVLLLAALGLYAREQVRAAENEAKAQRLEAVAAVQNAAVTRLRFCDAMRQAQVSVLDMPGAAPAGRRRALALCSEALAIYHLPDDPAWAEAPAVRLLPPAEEERLRDDLTELLLLAARARVVPPNGDTGPAPRQRVEEALALDHLAEACVPDRVPPAVWLQRAALLTRLGADDEAKAMADRAREGRPATDRDHVLLAGEEMLDGRYAEAQARLEEVARRAPERFSVWLDLAVCYERRGYFREAAACYGTCTALAPKLAPLYLKRAIASHEQGDYERAEADLDQALRLKPDFADAYLHRALARAGRKHYREAVGDVTEAIKRGSPPARAYLVRARLHALGGDADAAWRDRAEGFRKEPEGEMCWLARASARSLPAEAKEALADVEQALRCNARSLPSLQKQAHILAELLDRPKEALAVLDETVQRFPGHAPAYAGRGVLRARQGDGPAAQDDARKALDRDRSPAILYQVACVYALTSAGKDDVRAQALRLLGDALRQGYGWEYLTGDRDLDPLRDTPEFQRLLKDPRARAQR